MIGSFLRALAAFFFGVLWFCVCVVGIVILTIPQVVCNAYSRTTEHHFIDSFLNVMDEIFKLFKEN